MDYSPLPLGKQMLEDTKSCTFLHIDSRRFFAPFRACAV